MTKMPIVKYFFILLLCFLFSGKSGLCYTVGIESPLVRIGKEKIPKRRDSASIYSAKNEYESFQVLIRSKKRLEKVYVSFTDLINSSNSKFSIPKTNLEYNLIKYVNKSIPDVLGKEREFNLEKNSTYSIWITVYTPIDAKSGLYNGKIIIKSANSSPTIIKLSLNVWNFALPKNTHLKTALFGFSHARGAELKTFEENPYILNVFQSYIKHRVTPGGICGMKGKVRKLFLDNREEFWEYFDKWARYWIENGLNIGAIPFAYPVIEGKGEWRAAHSIVHNKEFNDTELIEYYRIWEKHIVERGWQEKTFLRHLDEVTDPRISQFMGKIMKKAAPSLKRMATSMVRGNTNPNTLKSFVGAVDIWVIQPQTAWDSEEEIKFFQERQEAGEEVWWYIHEYVRIFDPPLRTRIFFWALMKYNITGCCLWNTTAWSRSNVRLDKDGNIRAQVDSNTAGILFWPEKGGDILESVRWQLIRDGIEDYSYWCILKERVKGADEKLKKQFEETLHIYNGFITGYQDYIDDPAEIYKARRKIAEKIIEK